MVRLYLLWQLSNASDLGQVLSDGTVYDTFVKLEASILIEMLHHFVGIKHIKRHHAINILSQLFILFCVIRLTPLVSDNPSKTL